ncbi:tumor necrosis factor receptor superfamily member 6B-like [Cololabis saira]|uniref:tumor necrosis factor receptor superfamily member 6B-like n=1 Tax=Cololabis saira TaxID=129043 RepID=UPI002AD436EF|nr:tumor necrosis factor receptor superfamily member 6B-like [Cololabis saira]
MCPAGSRVKTHCTEFRSTSCLPCEDATFMDKLNGLKQCHQCSNCDSGSGLKIRLPCTPTSDTVCEPVEGFFCIDPGSPGCTAAQKHRSCEPGQYIRERDAGLVCLKFKISVRWFLQLKKTCYVLHKMTLRGKHLTAITMLIIVTTVFSVQTLRCHLTEYQTGNKCCRNCHTGRRVQTDCTESITRSCLRCEDGTFMDRPNGLKKCHQCTNCDLGSGLKVKWPCTPASDTVCEPMEGFFCISTRRGCTAAHKHGSCEPGQYIRERGNASSDTECSDCSSGTFSNGTLTSCQPHTQCETNHLQVIKAGTASTDAECGEQSFTTPILAGAVVPVVFLCLVVVALIIYRKKLIKYVQGFVGKVGKIKQNGHNNITITQHNNINRSMGEEDGNGGNRELQILTEEGSNLVSGFLPGSKNMHARIDDSKLPVGVSVSGCLSEYVARRWTGELSR